MMDDCHAILDILLNSGIFNRTDAECVDQMFNEAFTKPEEDTYRFLSCWEGITLVGFACYGHESLTQDTWDLFWVCVSGATRRKGAGRALLTEVQHRAAQERGRLIVIYTSSTEKYTPARGLYESMGFTRTAVVPDYYADGDDLYIYSKRLAWRES
ncbi:MAG: GNAT family N-acetyltransferase [Chloroflexi bacterium]|nr:GNAT family N-acetyltransferase [Chloroflexota bacterium]